MTTTSEDIMAKRTFVDLSAVTSETTVHSPNVETSCSADNFELVDVKPDYDTLCQACEQTPWLAPDKFKSVIESAWEFPEKSGAKGLAFAHDEAHNLAERASGEQFPLSVILDTFQSLQKRKNCS